MRQIYLILLCASTAYLVSSCSDEDKTNQKLEAKWKTVSDSEGNKYEPGTVTFGDTNGDGVVTDADYKQEMLMENVKTGASETGDPVKNSQGLLVTACYKDMSVNCDTLGALYTADNIFGKSVSDQAKSIASSGDADGDGYNDEAVRKALIAAGYDPDIYTITPEYDPDNGITGETAAEEYGAGNGSVDNSKGNITYSIDKTTGDTIYTSGAGGKILVPDLSKIDLSSIAVVKGPQGNCPEGYHIPTDGEWKLLELAMGMTRLDVSREGIETDRGGKSKLGSKLASSLNLKYAGYWAENNTYAQLGEVEVMWTSSAGIDAKGESYVWIRYIDTLQHKGIIRKKQYERSAFGVRCFKD